MQINLSEIQITTVKPKNGLLAFVSFVLNNSFYIGDVALYSRLGEDSFRLVYPAKTLRTGHRINCFCPITPEAGQMVEEQVADEFSKLIEKLRVKQRSLQQNKMRAELQ